MSVPAPSPELLGGPCLPQRRELRTAVPGPRSLALAQRRSAVVAAGLSSALPVYAAAAGGGVLVDVDDNSFVDLGSGIAVTTVGNSAPKVVAAATEALSRFTHTCAMITPYEGYVRLAEELAAITPGDHHKRTALFNTGSEAVENAVKIARHATGRSGVAVVDHAYHGRTNLTLAMTAKNMPYKDGFGPFASDVFRAPTSYPFRDGADLDGNPVDGPAAARRAIEHLERSAGAERLAALVIEPVQGEGGFIVPAPGFLAEIARWCADHGIVFVADEVQTGVARTGAWFASEHENVVPDLITTAKGLGGGLPIAAVTGRADLMDSVHPGGLGGTYGGNPVACAAALAALDTIREDCLIDRARAIGDAAGGRLRALAETDPRIGDVRGRGAMLGVEFVRPGTHEPDPGLAKAVAGYAHRAGVIVLTCGSFGNVIRLLPPLTIPDELLHDGLDVLAEALEAAR
ncbi:4-aminobutyrate--2-oxoglutarate transaminase [Saccharopolyspora gloriosae]|uniref:(S)-3-amino-2-methylpropionate transaminase n=1 Tax=Saccharopolyspora gloriosae TaxID=455344 RepID=A0A840NG42_9PSEU|nr:4-aminobutyrate--2-oxoglutarate transaminase [Saccharopolyspora gloriosae]MBB5068279.1 4-aminobutyrate aminotransferase/(S)-3-amino-2-methylpropionate transaminase [Saccharopolyspora gloriosae]